MNYPPREQFFAHRFVRLLLKSCAALDIGQPACLLTVFIAHQEDSARYRGPVRFWNQQLMNCMGFKSPKQLVEARQKAIDAGWLHYERAGNREVGQYFVTIPDSVLCLDDTPIEENHSVIRSAIHSESGMNTERKAERISDGKRNENVTESGKHSIPIPDPIPTTTAAIFGEGHIPERLSTEDLDALAQWIIMVQQRDPSRMPSDSPQTDALLKLANGWKKQGMSIPEICNAAIVGGWMNLRPQQAKKTASQSSVTHPDFLDIQKIAREHGSANEADQDWRRQNMTVEQKKARKAIGGDWSQFVTASGFDLKTLADRYLAELERARANG